VEPEEDSDPAMTEKSLEQKELERLSRNIHRTKNPAEELKKKKEQEAKRKAEAEKKKKQEADEFQRRKQREEDIRQQILKQKEEDEKREKEEAEKQEHTKQVEKSLDQDEEAKKEAEQWAKRFGISTSKITNDSPVISHHHPAVISPRNEDEKSIEEREAERMAKAMGGNPRQYAKPQKEIEHDRDMEKLKQMMNQLDTSDPKAFSKALLEDPEIAARFRQANSLLAVKKLEGTEVPGHKFSLK